MNRGPLFLALIAALAFRPATALAHAGAPIAPHDLWRAWDADPALLIGLTLTGWLYGRGVAALWRRAGRGRGVRLWRVAAFGGGLVALGVALVSPLAALSGALFSAHMAQHLLLVLVAAALLVLGAPLVPLLWALPRPWRHALVRWASGATPRAILRGLTFPVTVLILYVAAMWAWHVPVLYEAALAHEPFHILEHASLLGTALLFWWTVLQPHGRRRLGYGAGVIFIFAAALQGTALGALITFSGRPWYPTYAASAPAWGLSPAADQQLAGAIMGAPTDTLYLIVALTFVVASLGTTGRDAARREGIAGPPPVAAVVPARSARLEGGD